MKKKADSIRFSAFQLRVWEAALKIPFGSTRSYSWVARRIGSPQAVRAVGTALKNNPYPLVIPCHRVVKSNGDIGGYSQGRKAKEQLLELEKGMKKILSPKRERCEK